ncbi:hypothetical protein Btru_019491 [Bulinus truncatus]|nr:hypothetical protein Btru_019491 [Bulinus truncatus]
MISSHQCVVAEDCGGLHVLGPGTAEVIIKSPGYDVKYPNNIACQWTVVTMGNQTLEAEFLDLDVEYQRTCQFDSVYLDSMNCDFQQPRVLCGDDLPKPIKTTGNLFCLRFVTDVIIQKRGFSLKVKISGSVSQGSYRLSVPGALQAQCPRGPTCSLSQGPYRLSVPGVLQAQCHRGPTGSVSQGSYRLSVPGVIQAQCPRGLQTQCPRGPTGSVLQGPYRLSVPDNYTVRTLEDIAPADFTAHARSVSSFQTIPCNPFPVLLTADAMINTPWGEMWRQYPPTVTCRWIVLGTALLEIDNPELKHHLGCNYDKFVMMEGDEVDPLSTVELCGKTTPDQVIVQTPKLIVFTSNRVLQSRSFKTRLDFINQSEASQFLTTSNIVTSTVNTELELTSSLTSLSPTSASSITSLPISASATSPAATATSTTASSTTSSSTTASSTLLSILTSSSSATEVKTTFMRFSSPPTTDHPQNEEVNASTTNISYNQSLPPTTSSSVADTSKRIPPALPTAFNSETEESMYTDPTSITTTKSTNVLDVEIDSACSGVPSVRSDAWGTIASPGFYVNQSYPLNVKCRWIIEGGEDKVISLTFTTFDVEFQPNCSYDYLAIYNVTRGNQLLMGRYCGRGRPGTLTSYYIDRLELYFESDRMITSSGFELTYRVETATTSQPGDLVAIDARGDLVAIDARGDLVAINARGDLVAIDARGDLVAIDARGDLVAINARGDLVAIDARVCQLGRVHCQGSQECIPVEWLCDDEPDCPLGDDETSCSICGDDEVTCSDKTCVPSYHICDGTGQCPHSEDESQCTRVNEDQLLQIMNSGQWFPVCSQNWNNSVMIDPISTQWFCSDGGRGLPLVTTFIHVTVRNNNVTLADIGSQSPVLPVTVTTHVSSVCPDSLVVKLNCAMKVCGYRNVHLPQPFVIVCPFTECGYRNVHLPQPFVIDAVESFNGQWPWVAAIFSGSLFRCGATLISDHWVVSAGHCVFNMLNSPETTTVRIGYVNINSPDATSLRVTEIVNHPANNYIYDNDIALLRLERPIYLSDLHRPICLGNYQKDRSPSLICYVAGWGVMNKSSTSSLELTSLLHHTKIKLWEHSKCLKAYPDQIKPTMMCAGYESGGMDACKLDCRSSYHHYVYSLVVTAKLSL